MKILIAREVAGPEAERIAASPIPIPLPARSRARRVAWARCDENDATTGVSCLTVLQAKPEARRATLLCVSLGVLPVV